MRRNARVDANQPEIVLGLRKYGATVLITSQLKNCFDILVGFEGVNHIMEIKDENQPLSKRKLTEGEEGFKEKWQGGNYNIVKNLRQAIEVLEDNTCYSKY